MPINTLRSAHRSIGFGKAPQTFSLSARPSSTTSLLGVLVRLADHDDVGPALDRRELAKDVEPDVFAEPEIERNAVELLSTQPPDRQPRSCAPCWW